MLAGGACSAWGCCPEDDLSLIHPSYLKMAPSCWKNTFFPSTPRAPWVPRQRALISHRDLSAMVPSTTGAMHSQQGLTQLLPLLGRRSLSFLEVFCLVSEPKVKSAPLMTPTKHCNPSAAFPTFVPLGLLPASWLAASLVVRCGHRWTMMEWYKSRVVKWVENYQKEEKIEMKLPMMQFPWQLPFYTQF